MTEPRFPRPSFSSKDKIKLDIARATEKKSQESFERWQKRFQIAQEKTSKNLNKIFEYSELFSDISLSSFRSIFITKITCDRRYSNLYANSGILETHTFTHLDGRYCFCPNSQVDALKAEARRKATEMILTTKKDKNNELNNIIIKDLFSKLQIGGKVHWMQIRQLYNDKEINGSKVAMHEKASQKLLLKLASEGYLEETRVEKEIWYKRIK